MIELESIIQQLTEKLLNAGMSLVWSAVFLIIGLKVISFARKFLKRTLERANIDVGVVQFLDAFFKIAAYTVLVLALLARFGIQTTSFITILGSAGVAIGLSLQGSLSNFAGGITILIRPWVKSVDYWDVKWRTLERVHDRLGAEGIEIPFPQVTVHMEDGEK